MGFKDATKSKKRKKGKKRSSSSGDDVFSRGSSALKKRINRNKKKSEALRGKYVPVFWMRDGESALVRFLEDEPISVYEHSVKTEFGYRSFTCRNPVEAEPTEGVCPLCDAGFNRSLRAVYNIIDRREWVDKKKSKHKDEVKLLKASTRFFPSLDKLKDKKRLMGREIEITRTGASTDTTYSAIPEDKSKLSAKDRNATLIDIEDVLKPLSKQALERLIGVGGDDDDESWDDEDE